MSESEFSLESYTTWRPLSVCTQNLTDGINLRELVLDGIDRDTKNAIIDFLKGYKLDVTGVDTDTYTVDLTKWGRNKSEQFIKLLKTMGGALPEMTEKDDDEAPESVVTVLSAAVSTDNEKNIFEDPIHNNKSSSPPIERRFPIQPHPAEELDFEYAQPFPVPTNPIYQKNELLNIKPMLLKEDTQSTMGSANVGVGKIKNSCFSLKCVVNCISFPFQQLKRLKICRFIRKNMFNTKSKEEKLRKKKAFAVYSTLLEEGPRYGREFKASLQGPICGCRTVATNTWDKPHCDDWSMNSEVLKVDKGVNAVWPVADVGVNTAHVRVLGTSQLRDIPKVFSDPEEEPITWCPCQFITSSFLYRSISKCLSYICDWEDSNTELIKQDIESQKEELREVRSMLMGALELLEKARKSNSKIYYGETH